MLELVTHCYAMEYPHYAALLNYQLSSLVLHPPKCHVSIVVCYILKDTATHGVINHFCGYTNLDISVITLTEREIGRRAIGRNIAASSTKADVMWFTDVDHVFIECLDDLMSREWVDGSTMLFPRIIQIQASHALGDMYIKRAIGVAKPHDINQKEFIAKKYRRAIGGVQIVRGDFAREHGYLKTFKKWQNPTDTPFKEFRDDIAYRNFCLRFGNITAIDLPGMYRLRHTQTTHGK